MIQDLDEYSLLQQLLPEVKNLQGVIQGPKYHSEGDAYIHTLLCLENLSKGANSKLIWATLFHDLGKAAVQEIVNAEEIHFYKHEEASQKIARKILNRLKFSNREKEEILFLIKNHMLLFHCLQMREAKRKRLIRHKYFPNLFLLWKADLFSSVPKDPQIREKDFEKLEKVKKLYQEEKEELKKGETKPFITGEDLITLSLKPGPLFKRILREVEDLQLEKKLKSKKGALEYVKKKYL